VKELTGGKGVHVVMDAVGKDTFEGSLDSLRRFGMMISFGNASGPVPPFNIATLAAEGIAEDHAADPVHPYRDHETCQQMARELFEKVLSRARSRSASISVSRSRTWPRRTARWRRGRPPARRS
jgi:NADPH2:quinone reductase